MKIVECHNFVEYHKYVDVDLCLYYLTNNTNHQTGKYFLIDQFQMILRRPMQALGEG